MIITHNIIIISQSFDVNNKMWLRALIVPDISAIYLVPMEFVQYFISNINRHKRNSH